ncbi:MAG: MDR family oxidoreductase [Acidobacteriota bacterium]
MPQFSALLLTETGGKLVRMETAELPPGEVLVEVRYSSLNYKDGLAIAGKPGVVRKFPMIPGIDLAGVVRESSAAGLPAGTEVAVTGCGLGERHWGGYAGYARVQAEWCVPVPAPFTLRQAMAIGTAGFTAMQCVDALERHGAKPEGGEIVVTGAAGGVGSIAVALLAARGFRVTASTGRAALGEYLRGLGAAEVIDREVLRAASAKPMEKERWGGAVDTVGGTTLGGIIRQLRANASVAACGLAGGTELATTVLPFILRGVNLLGINSVEVANGERRRIWARLAETMPLDKLDGLTSEVSLDRVPLQTPAILDGEVRGRVVVVI